MQSIRILGLSLLLGLGLSGAQVHAGEVSVAVAANFTKASQEIARLFQAASGHTAKLSYGSTGKLYAQISHGAPFEVYLAADSEHPRLAEQKGLAVAGSRFVYARGRLALWSAEADAFESGEDFLKRAEFRHLAIANPKTAPYGLAAQQVMQSLGAWHGLHDRLVRGDSIAQTFQFVATRNAEAGFVAYAQIKGWKGPPGSIWMPPESAYAPIEQAAVLLERGAANPAARAFVAFLRDDTARKVIESYGYGVE